MTLGYPGTTELEVKERDKTQYKTDHIPVSFSICTNLTLDNDDVKCFVDREHTL